MKILSRADESAHYYFPDGRPCYTVKKKDGGDRPTNIADCRKLGLFPSVTQVLRLLAKPGIEIWKQEQLLLVALTSPRLPDEGLDAFIKRVLSVDKEQDAEAAKARELGTRIHDAIEAALSFNAIDQNELAVFVQPVVAAVKEMGNVMATEKIMVGEGYAGRIDAILDGNEITVVDFKTTKSLPKESWTEHQIQLAAYAMALGNSSGKKIKTVNIYISTINVGKIVVCQNPDWQKTFEHGFKPILNYWQFANDLIK